MVTLFKERMKKLFGEFVGKAQGESLLTEHKYLAELVEGSEQEKKDTETRISVFDRLRNTYLEELPAAEPITVAQFQKTLSPSVIVSIKPSSHKTYWRGEAIFIPKDFYNCKVNDIVLRKKGQEEECYSGSLGLYIDKMEEYEKISDRKELAEINNYYRRQKDSI